MEAHQAPPSLGFSRQEHWSGVPFPSPGHESESEAAQSCPTLCDPVEGSLPGCSIHRIFQARVLEWGAIAFSETSSRISEIEDREQNKKEKAIWRKKRQHFFKKLSLEIRMYTVKKRDFLVAQW